MTAQTKDYRYLPVHVRWMVGIDVPQVNEIEQNTFEFPWPKFYFHECLGDKSYYGFVAESNEKILASAFFKNKGHYLTIPNFVVLDRRRGVGTQLFTESLELLSKTGHLEDVDGLKTLVPETNLGGQLFFSSLGFRAGMVFKNSFEDYYNRTFEDGFLMKLPISNLIRRSVSAKAMAF